MKHLVILTLSLAIVLGLSRFAVADLDANLIAYYPLNGNAYDESGYENNGTEQGSISYVAGKYGQAASFDGTGDYIEISQLLSYGDFTICFWLKSYGSQNNLSVPISQGHGGSSGNKGFAFQYNYPTSNSLSFIWGDVSAWHGLDFNYDLKTDLSWHFLAVTRSGDTFAIFKDGILQDTESRYSLEFGQYEFSIGRDSKNSDYNHRAFSGAIDDVRVYMRALSEYEIKELLTIETAPSPDIKANGSDNPIQLNVGDNLSLVLSCSAGSHQYENVDWWIVAVSPDGQLYYYDLSGQWKQGFTATYQSPLFDLWAFSIDTSGLPITNGQYSFYFAIDLNMNGKLDSNVLYYDVVRTTFDGIPNTTYTNTLGMTFVLLPASTFTMGSSDGELGRDSDEGPQHQVTLTQPFYMQETEVTQAQWETVMGANPSYFSGCPNCPVEFVSWNDVQGFIKAMNTLGEGTYSLPTEAQWEFACRAGTTTAFYSGEITEFSDMSVCNYDANMHLIGWYCYNSDLNSHPVAQNVPNAWGLYDMSGNVSEWCSDWYYSDYYEISPGKDPVVKSWGLSKVVRGGSWGHYAKYCRSALRSSKSPDDRHNGIGFRLLMQP